jgi:hypothetical protein
MRAANDRLVLCPYGIAPEHRAACSAILLECGGDLSRVIDGPPGAAPFLAHVRRLSSMLAAVRPPLVLLTSIMPLVQQVILLRKDYERELPPLRLADWLLYVDGSGPAFFREALRLGKLDHSQATPAWHSPSGGRYLVVSAGSNLSELGHSMAALGGAEHTLVQRPTRPSLHSLGYTSASKNLKR